MLSSSTKRNHTGVYKKKYSLQDVESNPPNLLSIGSILYRFTANEKKLGGLKVELEVHILTRPQWKIMWNINRTNTWWHCWAAKWFGSSLCATGKSREVLFTTGCFPDTEVQDKEIQEKRCW